MLFWKKTLIAAALLCSSSYSVYAGDITGFRHTSSNGAGSAYYIKNPVGAVVEEGSLIFKNSADEAVIAYIHNKQGDVVKTLVIPPTSETYFNKTSAALRQSIKRKDVSKLLELFDDQVSTKFNPGVSINDFPEGGAISYATGTKETIAVTAVSVATQAFSLLIGSSLDALGGSKQDKQSIIQLTNSKMIEALVTDDNAVNTIFTHIKNNNYAEASKFIAYWVSEKGTDVFNNEIKPKIFYQFDGVLRFTSDKNNKFNEKTDELFDSIKPLELTSSISNALSKLVNVSYQKSFGPHLLNSFDMPFSNDDYLTPHLFNWNGTEISNREPVYWSAKINDHDSKYNKYLPWTWKHGFEAEYQRFISTKSIEAQEYLAKIKNENANQNVVKISCDTTDSIICLNNNTQMNGNISRAIQGNTSHFGSVDYYFNPLNIVPTYNNRQRETIQENPYLAAGSRIVEAPADIVLNWGARPADLDSHLTGPVDASGRERFHTFYANRGSLDAAPNALLYRDDTSHGVGRENLPEQTRINVTQPGVYNFYVHDYSNMHQTGSMEMSNSGARVSLHSAGNRELPEGRNLGTKVAEYSIPTNREGTAWHVFELDTRRNVITPVNTLYNVSDPTKVPVK